MLISIAIPVLGTYFMVYALLGSIFFFAGMWSLRAGRDVWACWPAILYGGGSAVIAANAQGKVSAWEAGNKLVVWDVLSFSFFVIVVVAILFYLAIRERHRLFHWRYGARATMKSDSLEHSSQGQTRMGCGGWVGLTAFAVLLAMAAALTAPFLWHTAESDEGGGSDEPSEQVQQAEPEEQGRKKGKRKASQSDDGDGMDSADMVQRAEEMMEQAQKAAQQAFNILYYLLWILFILLMLYAIFYRPMHRLFWIRHYRQPLWKVPNTTRILNYWRLLCIGFRDAGVEVSPASTANQLLEAVNSQQAEAFGTIVIPGLDDLCRNPRPCAFWAWCATTRHQHHGRCGLVRLRHALGSVGVWAQVRDSIVRLTSEVLASFALRRSHLWSHLGAAHFDQLEWHIMGLLKADEGLVCQIKNKHCLV